MDIRIRAVILSTEGIKTDKEISSSFGISERTLRRWKKSYKLSGISGLNPISTKRGLLIRVKAKPQPCKRFARHHVDSMWQGDTF